MIEGLVGRIGCDDPKCDCHKRYPKKMKGLYYMEVFLLNTQGARVSTEGKYFGFFPSEELLMESFNKNAEDFFEKCFGLGITIHDNIPPSSELN